MHKEQISLANIKKQSRTSFTGKPVPGAVNAALLTRSADYYTLFERGEMKNRSRQKAEGGKS